MIDCQINTISIHMVLLLSFPPSGTFLLSSVLTRCIFCRKDIGCYSPSISLNRIFHTLLLTNHLYFRLNKLIAFNSYILHSYNIFKNIFAKSFFFPYRFSFYYQDFVLLCYFSDSIYWSGFINFFHSKCSMNSFINIFILLQAFPLFIYKIYFPLLILTFHTFISILLST